MDIKKHEDTEILKALKKSEYAAFTVESNNNKLTAVQAVSNIQAGRRKNTSIFGFCRVSERLLPLDSDA